MYYCYTHGPRALFGANRTDGYGPFRGLFAIECLHLCVVSGGGNREDIGGMRLFRGYIKREGVLRGERVVLGSAG